MTRRHPSGKVNLIAVVLIAAVIYGLWWIITFSGAYFDNLDVKDAAVAAYNESGRINDASLYTHIQMKTNSSTLGWHEEDDGFGTIKVSGGLGLNEENIKITRDDVAKTITITIDYQRKVYLKPFNKIKYVPFHVVQAGPVPQMSSQ